MLIDWAKERDKHDREKVVGYLTAMIGLALKSMEIYDQSSNTFLFIRKAARHASIQCGVLL